VLTHDEYQGDRVSLLGDKYSRSKQLVTIYINRNQRYHMWPVSVPISLQRALACPGILFGGGGSTNSVEDRGQRERGSGSGSPLVRGSGSSCNSVQEISFHTVKFS